MNLICFSIGFDYSKERRREYVIERGNCVYFVNDYVDIVVGYLGKKEKWRLEVFYFVIVLNWSSGMD